MKAWQERFDAIGDGARRCAMLAIELVQSRETKEPAPELATRVIEESLKRGLLLLKRDFMETVYACWRRW